MKRVIWIHFLLIFSFFSPLMGVACAEIYDGNDWNSISIAEKSAYLDGYRQAVLFAMPYPENAINECVRKLATEPSYEPVLGEDLPYTILSIQKIFMGAKSQILENVDLFYRDPENRKICVKDIVFLAAIRTKGGIGKEIVDDEEVKDRLLRLRENTRF